MSTPELMKVAAHWFLTVRNADAQSEEHATWLAWMEADPAHRRAFEQIQETWNVARALDWPEEISDPAPVPVPLRSTIRWRWSAIAACTVVALSAIIFKLISVPNTSITERVATSRGQHQARTLPDGSHVDLGGATALNVQFTPEQRLIVADEGEAFFAVKHDTHRPFVVKTGKVRVVAVGTSFSVRREANFVSVTVQDGVVNVFNESAGAAEDGEPLQAHAGERLEIDISDPHHPVGSTSKTDSARWVAGRLHFEGEPLGVVVASLNRYSDREILLGDPTLATLQFSGTIFDDRIPQWLEGIQHLFPVALREIDSRHVVLERRSPSEPGNPAR